jgi:hypothetical protein
MSKVTRDLRWFARNLSKERIIGHAVMIEAKRLARQAVKDAIVKEGGKVSHYEAKEITMTADKLIEEDSSYIKRAKRNMKA